MEKISIVAYFYATVQISVGGQESDFMPPNGGVHQGTKPNPLGILCIIQMNDLDPAIAPINSKMTQLSRSHLSRRGSRISKGGGWEGPRSKMTIFAPSSWKRIYHCYGNNLSALQTEAEQFERDYHAKLLMFVINFVVE